MTQDQFAEAVGRSRSLVAAWESGRKPPGRDALRRISRVCKVSIDVLADDADLEVQAKGESLIIAAMYEQADDATKAAVMHILQMASSTKAN